MKQAFLNHIAQKKLFGSKEKILLAVSGGMDSMVMLSLFRECSIDFSVAHANFQLRGDESEGDEKFAKTYCQELSVPFFSKKFETKEYAARHHLSIQMAARELRYTWFDELLSEHHFDFVVTAHHANDSIETTLLNLTRGAGLEGLDGITSKNEKVIRPLLFATRGQIENYAKENKILWREDRSNATDDYPRNFIRHHVVPKLKELNPSLENSLRESTEKISGAVELMALGIKHWREKFETKKDEQILFDKKGLEQFDHAENVLWNLIKGYGFNFDQCGQAAKAFYGQAGKKFFSEKFELIVDREHLIICPRPARREFYVGEGVILIQKNQTEARLGNLILEIEEGEKTELKNNPSVAQLDAAKLQFPLRWRKWKPGDYFYPLGMVNKKKLSDFFIDQKISLADKKNITILESGNEIVWVVGLRIDERYKIALDTKSTVLCRLSIVG